MPPRLQKRSTSRMQSRGRAQKRKTLTLTKPSSSAGHAPARHGSRNTLTSARFLAATRRLLSRYARDLEVCITHGRHLEREDYARLLRDLQALHAATAKVVTEVAHLADKE